MADDRRFHVVLFGATGFTGGLTAEYLAERAAADEGLRWAVAGRSRDKLDALVRRLEARTPGAADRVGTIVADLAEPASLVDMAREATVVATTVGPYGRYGEPVVRSCVEARTHYVDITGEPAFVGRMIRGYGERARDEGLRIVSCCGFDCIPADLGALFTVRELPRDVPITVEGFVSARGAPSGGTWTSALEGFATARTEMNDIRVVTRGETDDDRRVRGIRPKLRHDEDFDAWVCPLPTIDPFIVLRSARVLSEYGPDFRYGHYARVERLRTVIGGAAGVGALFALSQLGPTRELLRRFRPSGSGPTERQRERGRFEVIFRGRGGDQRVVTRVSGGDPGYGETSKMLAESALCLALDGDRLPPDGVGVTTTAVAMGMPLLERVRAAGIAFEVMERGAPP